MNETIIDPTISIPAFYAGKSIFLTGGTGFLGKVFIEKLLRSCPQIREIFLLIRPKKDASIHERMEKFINLQVFDRVREEQPSSFEKLIPISGDMNTEGLGLLAADRQMLIERTTVVVHCAASLKFNYTLTSAIFTNIRSTRDICMLAENMKNLVALIYVSTAYIYTDEPVVKEQLYPHVTDWQKTIEIAESLDEHTLTVFTSKYIMNKHNKYVFTKSLAEAVIQDYSAKLPCVIFRTSQVIFTISEPFVGWTDNLNGPMALNVAVSKGVLHVAYVHPDQYNDMIPVDVVIKSLIQVIWNRGLTTYGNRAYVTTADSVPLVINCTTGSMQMITMSTHLTVGREVVKTISLDSYLPFGFVMATNHFMFYILFMLWDYLPGLLVDLVLKYIGRKSILTKVHKTIYSMNCFLSYYIRNSWIFENSNMLALNKAVPPDNAKEFKFEWGNMTRRELTMIGQMGLKKFYFKEDVNPAAIEACNGRRRKIQLVFKLLIICIGLGTLWLIYKCGLHLLALEYVPSTLYNQITMYQELHKDVKILSEYM